MPPQPTLDKTEIALFQEREHLYRRYLASHFEDGELDPSAIRFNEPPSFLRSCFSVPEDAIHPNCADGQDVSKYGVLQMAASAAHFEARTLDSTIYQFSPVHRPLPSCYAHSEIHCRRVAELSGTHVEPPKDVKKAFRLRIARALSVTIPAPAQ